MKQKSRNHLFTSYVWAIIAFLDLLLLPGCDFSLKSGKIGSENNSLPFEPIAADKLACAQDCPDCGQRDAAELFGWDSVPVFEFHLPEDRWEHLQSHALDEVYEQACGYFEGVSIGTVGLRFKGSYGTLYPCINDKGELTCTKLSMKVKFSEIYPELRFYGLQRLNFHSMIHDPSKMHERLGYDLYREMDIPSPQSSWAVLRINGKSYGLFSMVEQIDGRFTDNRWPGNGDGNLFKEAWPSTADSYYYMEHLKTNKNTALADAFIRFHVELSATAPGNRSTVLDKWTNVKQLLRYMAVDDAIFNCDGITAFYTDADRSWTINHNYYFYQEEDRDYFWLIPWDLDATFIPRGDWSLVPRWNIIPQDCSQLYNVWNTGMTVVAPGCDIVFQALAEDPGVYKAAIDQLLAGPFAQETMIAKIDKLAAFIASAVEADTLGPGRAEWEGSVAQLKTSIPILRRRLEMLRNNESTAPLGLAPTGINEFENTTDMQLLLGTTLIYNPSSTVRQFINKANPLDSLQDIKLEFEYRNGKLPHSQWINYSIPLAAGNTDLRSFKGVRLLARADRLRNLRIDLESPANSLATEGIKQGWHVRVNASPILLELHLSQAAAPDWSGRRGKEQNKKLSDVLGSVTGLGFHPQCRGKDATGLLPPDSTDAGFLQVDNIEFFTE